MSYYQNSNDGSRNYSRGNNHRYRRMRGRGRGRGGRNNYNLQHHQDFERNRNSGYEYRNQGPPRNQFHDQRSRNRNYDDRQGHNQEYYDNRPPRDEYYDNRQPTRSRHYDQRDRNHNSQQRGRDPRRRFQREPEIHVNRFQPQDDNFPFQVSKRKREPTPPLPRVGPSSGKKPPRKKRKLMEYSPEELEIRKHNFGSTLSVIDRQKFEREFDWKSLNLSKELEKVYHNNPHIRQVFANRRQFVRAPQPFTQDDRCLSLSTSPKLQYQRRQGEAKTVDHWGQRKLLMSEIEFLTIYGDKDYNTVVYAGAAPGTHTNFLSDLFPDLKFILVDPVDFKAFETDRIKIIQDFFTDEMAIKYSSQKTIFISDIRSMTREMNEQEKVQCVLRDMAMQRNWYNILKPKASLFKLRFPYCGGKTKYLKGKIFAPVWGGRTTTETRLVVTNENNIWPAEEVLYDHTEYEQMMFHFNTISRTTYWEHGFKYQESEGYCHCFDCNSEIRILKNYIKKIKKIPEFLYPPPPPPQKKEEEEGENDDLNMMKKIVENPDMKREVIRMSKIISRKITTAGKRTLLLESAMSFKYRQFTNNLKDNKSTNRRKKKRKMFKKRLQEGKEYSGLGLNVEMLTNNDEDLDDDEEEEQQLN